MARGVTEPNRNAIERMFGRLEDYRRIATRYDRLAENSMPPSASPPSSSTGFESWPYAIGSPNRPHHYRGGTLSALYLIAHPRQGLIALLLGIAAAHFEGDESFSK